MTLTDDQLALRKTGIGGSDIGTLLGLNPYRSPMHLWLDKTNRSAPWAGNEATDWGNRLEPLVAERYAEQHPEVLLTACGTLGEAPFFATPDRLCMQGYDVVRGLEIKTRDPRDKKHWGEPGTDAVPDDVMAQVQWCMGVTKIGVWDVAVLFGGKEYREYRVLANPEAFATMQRRARAWWDAHVVADVPPPPDGSPEVFEWLRGTPANDGAEMVPSTDFVRELALSMERTRRAVAQLHAEYAAQQQVMQGTIGHDLGFEGDWGSVRWSPVRGRKTIRWETVARELGRAVPKEEFDALVQMATEVGDETRRFTLNVREDEV